MSGWLYKRSRRRAIEDAKTIQANSLSLQPKPSVKPKEFVPVCLVEPATPTPQSAKHQPIEIILTGGRRIAVSAGFDEITLQRVITLLESR